MTGTLSHNKVYKIRTLISGKIITYTPGSDIVKVTADNNQAGQKWLAKNKGGDSWTLQSKVEGADTYLQYFQPSDKEPIITGSNSLTWTIVAEDSNAGTYSIWAQVELGPMYGEVIEVKDLSPDDAELWLKSWSEVADGDKTTHSWLFEEVDA